MSPDEASETYETLLREARDYRGPRTPGLNEAAKGVKKGLKHLSEINQNAKQ